MLASVFVSWVSLPCDVCEIAAYLRMGNQWDLAAEVAAMGSRSPGPQYGNICYTQAHSHQHEVKTSAVTSVGS